MAPERVRTDVDDLSETGLAEGTGSVVGEGELVKATVEARDGVVAGGVVAAETPSIGT